MTLAHLFRYLDRDFDGYISHQELQHHVETHLGIDVTLDELRDKRLETSTIENTTHRNTDKSGLISEKHFLNLVYVFDSHKDRTHKRGQGADLLREGVCVPGGLLGDEEGQHMTRPPLYDPNLGYKPMIGVSNRQNNGGKEEGSCSQQQEIVEKMWTRLTLGSATLKQLFQRIDKDSEP
jgi:hypothetical protein